MALRGAKKRALLALGLTAILAVVIVAVAQQLSEDSALAAARQAKALRHFPEAERRFQDYLEAHPEDLEARLLAAQTARQQRKNEEAGHHLRIFERQKGSPDALRTEYRALALVGGNLDEAEIVLQECGDRPQAPQTPILLESLIVGSLDLIRPHLTPHTPLPINLGSPLLVKIAPVIEFWLETQTAPADQEAGWVWRARLRELGSDHEAALADVRRVLQRDPNHFDAAFYHASFISADSPREALQRFEALSQHHSNPHLSFAIATSAHALGDLKKSRGILEQLVADNPQVSSPHLELGLVALDELKPEAAEPPLRKALAIAPQNAEVHFALARCMLMLGRHEEARQLQDRFLELEGKKGSTGLP